MENSKKLISWRWTTFWLIIFWPIGLFFLFKKLRADRTATLNNEKKVAIISYILMGISVIYLSIALTEDFSMLVPAILCGGGGFWVWNISRKMKSKSAKYKKYIAIVVNQYQSSIDYISSAVGVSYETVVKDLQEMIDAGYFTHAYIDQGGRTIVIPQMATEPTTETSGSQTKPTIVNCRSCGANNSIIPRQINKCEYCGSPL